MLRNDLQLQLITNNKRACMRDNQYLSGFIYLYLFVVIFFEVTS